MMSSVVAQPLTGDPKTGVQRATMCSGCHGIGGMRNAYPEVFRIPKLGHQYPEYIASALQAYRSGERSHSTMRAIAANLSDQAIADLAAYYGQGGTRGGVKP
ncbi:MAG: c-type cytochrome [Proteobacteria bacterium]|nr:c-type cytochrome [Burkholderiales bacterium]